MKNRDSKLKKWRCRKQNLRSDRTDKKVLNNSDSKLHREIEMKFKGDGVQHSGKT